MRTFHRIWPDLVVKNIIEPLGADPSAVAHHFFTYPATQCRRNRPNDPPRDYSGADALDYMELSLRPLSIEVREASLRAKEAVAEVRRARSEQGADWVNLEALTQQYIRRTEAWESFVKLEPEWRKFDAIVFNRPDVFLYDRLAAPSMPLKDDEIHVFTSLGPHKDKTGLDDRWAMGAPLAMERYMTVGESVVHQYAVEKRPWWPEEVNRRHADRTGLRIVKCSYQGPEWPEWAPKWEVGHVGIARFQDDDGMTLKEALSATLKRALPPRRRVT